MLSAVGSLSCGHPAISTYLAPKYENLGSNTWRPAMLLKMKVVVSRAPLMVLPPKISSPELLTCSAVCKCNFVPPWLPSVSILSVHCIAWLTPKSRTKESGDTGERRIATGERGSCRRMLGICNDTISPIGSHSSTPAPGGGGGPILSGTQ
jgi:hypothetical protein